MARNIFAFFVWVTVVAISIDASVITVPSNEIPPRPERPGFIFLGSTRKAIKTITVNGVSSVAYENWNYWLSANSAGYAEAARDCRENGDALLQIEAKEELDDIVPFLQDTDQTVSKVWVGAKYQVGMKQFTWESGSPILPDLWAQNEPSQSKPNSRGFANIVGQIIQLQAQANTHVTRYICEGKSNQQ